LRLAFCLFKFFPFGGLQRDFIDIARACQQRGHSISVFTMSWEGEVPQGFKVSLIPVKGWSNHRRCLNFSRKISEHLTKEQYDLVIGFNKMHGLDVYFAADPCYQARVREEKNFLCRMGNRYRTYKALEKAVFHHSAKTHILLISEWEKAKYLKYYGTADERFHYLPPGISFDRLIIDGGGQLRSNTRSEMGLDDDVFLLLMVASSFRTKGLDRALRALGGLPGSYKNRTKLVVIGDGDPGPFKKMARRLNISGSLFFLGGRSDVARFMNASDLLVHPARSETAGTVLIEAMAAGLPILVTDICGYAFHVEKARAGLLIPSPYDQKIFDRLLLHMLTSPERETWRRNGIDYVKSNDFFSRAEKAADIIETLAARGNQNGGVK